MHRWSLYLLSVVLTLIILAIAGLEALYAWRIEPVLQARLATQKMVYPRYKADSEFIQKTVPLAEFKQTKSDAGPYLNPRVYWAPERKGSPRKGASQPILPASLSESVLRLRSKWMEEAETIRRIDVDLSIFNGIEKFDHWDIESESSPIFELIENAIFVPPPQLPIPETSDLTALVKVRLMKGALQGDLLRALRETRQFSHLLVTTENIQLVLTGVALLDLERVAYLYGVAHLGLPANAWSPIPADFTQRAQRTVRATRGYLRLWTRPEQLEAIFLGPNEPPGFCAAVNEAFPLEYTLRPVLEPKVPFERDLRDEYARLDRIFKRAQSSCRIRYLSRLVQSGHFGIRFPGFLLFNRLPYSRKVFGMRLSTAHFNGFDAYLKPEGL